MKPASEPDATLTPRRLAPASSRSHIASSDSSAHRFEPVGCCGIGSGGGRRRLVHEQGRDQIGAARHHQLQRVVVDPVGMLDSVAARFDGGAQRRPAGGVRADMDALLVRLVASGPDLVDGHLEPIGLRVRILAERDARIELDEVGAALQLRAHAGAEPDRPVAGIGHVAERRRDRPSPAGPYARP